MHPDSKVVNETVKFTKDHIECFRDISYDLNPLHLDNQYARKTQFGRPIVYGMCLVLYGIGRWASGRKFRLDSIQVQFKKAVFSDIQYDLNISENANQITIDYLKGGSLKAKIVFKFSAFGSESDYTVCESSNTFQPQKNANENFDRFVNKGSEGHNEIKYLFNLKAASSLNQYFGLSVGQIPFVNLNSLLWASYFVGMLAPGKQALFTQFSFEYFTRENPDPSKTEGVFEIRNLQVDFDERFNQVKVSGSGNGIQAFKIQAFKRPPPVNYSITDIRKEIEPCVKLKDKVVFISGASRGFGAVLARAFCLHGAKVIINYQSSQIEAQQIYDEIVQSGGTALLLRGDVGTSEDCKNMARDVISHFGQIDFLVNNAYPQIEAIPFAEQEPEEFMKFLVKSVGMTLHLAHHMLPILAPAGAVINISTIYTQKPEPLFTHYITSKSAVEALMRTLAIEYKNIQFLNLRPSRMKTDQTNIAFDTNPAESPVLVAKKILQYVVHVQGSGGYHEMIF